MNYLVLQTSTLLNISALVPVLLNQALLNLITQTSAECEPEDVKGQKKD